MTKEERQQKRLISEQESAMREIQRTQKEVSATEYKQRARFRALETAQYLKPSTNYITDRLSGSQNITKLEPNYDIVKKAEEIYQWLIKVSK